MSHLHQLPQPKPEVPQPNPVLVEMLRRRLKEAEDGHLRSMVACFLTQDGYNADRAFDHACLHEYLPMVGVLETEKQFLVEALLDGADHEHHPGA